MYHLVPFGTLGRDGQEGQCYSVWDSPMMYYLVPFCTLGTDGMDKRDNAIVFGIVP